MYSVWCDKMYILGGWVQQGLGDTWDFGEVWAVEVNRDDFMYQKDWCTKKNDEFMSLCWNQHELIMFWLIVRCWVQQGLNVNSCIVHHIAEHVGCWNQQALFHVLLSCVMLSSTRVGSWSELWAVEINRPWICVLANCLQSHDLDFDYGVEINRVNPSAFG